VSSLQPRKNFPALLDAWERVVDATGEVELFVVGSRNSLFADAAVGSRRSVRYLGYVSDPELAWLYQHCLAYVNVSLYEGFGLTPLEAVAYGAPVVASDIPAHRESLADSAATLVDLTDGQALRSALVAASRKELPRTTLRSLRHWSDVAIDYDSHLTNLFA
jgi:glycosyltransferase involved in cell wall biosynthesis